jgi:predicted transcriptional regulator of viral defense system
MINTDKLKNLGVFKISEAISIGISQPTLSRLVKEGSVIKIARGLYMHPEVNIQAEEIDYIAACVKFGKKAYITAITSLFYYGLIEQVPNKIWLSVPANTRTTDTKYNLIRVKQYKPEGIIENKYYKIASIERTLVDCLKYSSKIGIRNVISAITRAVIDKKTKVENIIKLAKKLKLEKTLSKYWETIIGSIEGNL